LDCDVHLSLSCTFHLRARRRSSWHLVCRADFASSASWRSRGMWPVRTRSIR
jgi:hypothetical protein